MIKARIKAFFHWIRCHQILTDRYISAYQPGMSVITSIWCYECNEVFYDNPPKFEKIKTHLSYLIEEVAARINEKEATL